MKLVTAGTSQIGRQIVQRLDGDVLVHYYQNRELAEQLSPHTICADLSTTKGVADFLDRTADYRLEVVVNNYGLFESPESLESWEATMRINLILPALLCRRVEPGGVVINISSIGGRYGGDSAYSHSKVALDRLTRKLVGVRVNAVAPAEVPKEVRPEEVAEEVLKLVNDPDANHQITYMWGTSPGKIDHDNN